MPRARAIWVVVLLALGYTVISFNLIQIQLVNHAKFLRLAIENHGHRETIPPKRGAILDCEGNVLAETHLVYDVRLDGRKLDHPEVNMPRIEEALLAPAGSIAGAFDARNRFQLIAQNVEDAAVTRLRGLKLDCLIFEPRDERYPNNELAAHVLGFTGDDGHGLAGMEKEMDRELSGVPGEKWVEQDARRKEIAGYQTRDTPAIDGNDVTLTLNMAIQHVVEDALDQIVQNDQPNGACIIVMDPRTGAILGMGSRPTYEPNNRQTFTPDAVRNRCITDMVEPGSIFKIITLAAALNEGAVNLQTPVFCENGSFPYAGKTLHDDEPNGWLTVEEVLAKSSNIGVAKIALNYVHEENLYKYARAFGIGQRTGLLHNQDESAGLLRPLGKWSDLSITRIPIGQEVGVTAIQAAAAMSVIANGGNLVAPYLVQKVTDPASGRTVQIFQPKVIRQVISSDTAADVAQALHQVTVDGTAKNIRVPGHAFAAKTGTAQKFVDGAYSHTKFVSSFIGFMPVENPSFVALVMVDEPHTTKYYGAEVSGPIFAAMAGQLAQIMNIPADEPLPTPGPVLSANTPPVMKLSEILQDVTTKSIQGPVDRLIRALRYDSRRVEAGDVFFAWKGEKTDGHSFIAEVCDKDAAAVVLENPAFTSDRGPTFIEVESARRAMAVMSASFFGRPDRALKMAGVTGTNGKTTTSFILKHLLSEPKVPIGLIGTVRYEIGERILPAPRTTPESLDLHELLAQMKAANCRAAVMEVSSHALDQGRVAPIEFQVAIFTNLTQDHLDYHHTLENYFTAKTILFTNLDREKNPGVAVINADDAHGQRLIRLLAGRVRTIAYTLKGAAGAELEASDVTVTTAGTEGTLRVGTESFPFSLPLIGSYNVANALAAAGGALALGIDPRVIVERLRTTPPVPGRLEKFTSADGVTAVVDYAHTDDAVRQVLTNLRGITRGRLIVVLGCGGNRDAMKRPLMARAAVECADYAIFTADNPRNENVEVILDHMEAGIPRDAYTGKYERLADRRQAIAHALALAQPGDVVCVAGKGHETTQEIAGQFHPFDDRIVVREFLQRRAA